MTIDDLLRDWDEGKNITTCEMDGMGREFPIQQLAMELLRNMQITPFAYDIYDAASDEDKRQHYRDYQELMEKSTTIQKIMDGFSGAMVTAAYSLAFMFDKNGVEEAVSKIPTDRLITMNNQGIMQKI